MVRSPSHDDRSKPRPSLGQLVRRGGRSLLVLCLLPTLLLGCAKAKPQPALNNEAVHPAAETPTAASLRAQERAACTEKIRQVMAQPEVPGAPGFMSRRLEILSRAKAEPVVLTDTPRFLDTEDPGIGVRRFRELILKSEHPWDVIAARLTRFSALPEEGRATLLRDGYLYAEEPELAYALVNLIGAEHLFKDSQIWLQRGEFIYHAKRKVNRYYFSDGPNEGEPVRLLLLDRVGNGADPTPSDTMVRDFRALKYRQRFNQANVRHMTHDHIVATLRYGEYPVLSLLNADGARLSLACEIVEDAVFDAIEEEKLETARRERVVSALRLTMQQQIEEQIPFDEPRHEYGHQLDGNLRRNWLAAYLTGKNSFAYNGDRYKVFDTKGKPIPPQVCVDFLTDTLERTSGTWWQSKGGPRQRITGRLDFNMTELELAKLRRVPGFLSYAREQNNKFEVLEIEPRERIQLGDRDRFLSYLTTHWKEYQPGDMVVIRGKTPWDPSEEHYHSFFIYENDPLTGTPLALVGNAGRPSVRYWEVEARRTPERSLQQRIRPKTAWLEQILDTSRSIPSDPPPISPRGNAGD